jgi:hypothetical protein
MSENGSLSLDNRCFMWFTGPIRTENLWSVNVGVTTWKTGIVAYPNITSKLPRLNDSANLAGRSASSGSVKNETKKHTAAPMRHPPNPSNLE